MEKNVRNKKKGCQKRRKGKYMKTKTVSRGEDPRGTLQASKEQSSCTCAPKVTNVLPFVCSPKYRV